MRDAMSMRTELFGLKLATMAILGNVW